ncbi:MAG: hypothetical protein HFJ45_09645 [Clostridia bacterium]|nr:hypothetical protein [Clostridia bacterium]
MTDLIKKFGIWILIIAIFLLIFLGILLLQCFVFNKESFETKYANSSYLKSKREQEKNSSGINKFINDAYDSYKDANSKGENYNTYNFDDSLLLYEGKQGYFGVIKVLQKLIENADNSYYAKTSVRTENFGSLTKKIVYTNSNDYKSDLEELKNSIDNTGDYTISFGYTALHTVVNEIIITKN